MPASPRWGTRSGRLQVGSGSGSEEIVGTVLPLGYEHYCDTRSHVVSEHVEEVWLMPGT